MKLIELMDTNDDHRIVNLDAISDMEISKNYVVVWCYNNTHITISKEEYDKKLKKYVRKDTGFWRRAWSRLLGKGN